MVDHQLGHSPIDDDFLARDNGSFFRTEIMYHVRDIIAHPNAANGFARAALWAPYALALTQIRNVLLNF